MEAQKPIASIDVERDELKAVLSSRYFFRSPSLAQFLSYICEKYFQGESDQIKEYSIAVDAFGRSADFHPKEDPIIRVEASRLRKRLKEYYSGEGSAHPVQLTLPPGQYVPVFQHMEKAETSSPDALVQLAPAALEPFNDTHKELASLAENPRRRDSIPAQQPLIADRGGRWMFSAGWLVVGLVLGVGATIWVPRLLKDNAPQPEVAAALTTEPAVATNPSMASARAGEIRIRVGSLGKKYVDQIGNIWSDDRFFNGGVAFGPRDVAILGTRDAAIYQTGREGDFRYDIPLGPGTYELRLHFAETTYGIEESQEGGETMRLISATVNGKPLFNELDVASDASGSRVADVKIFTGITAAEDGLLHLHVSSSRGKGLLNGIELVPGVPGRMNPVRIVVGDSPRMTEGEKLWYPDRHSRGGRKVTRTNVIAATSEPDLFKGERHGNFAYTIPVVPGKYRVTLWFAETYFGKSNPGGGGAGSRTFNVNCGERSLLKNFDIYKEAGGENRAISRTFRAVDSNPQDKLVLSFVPVRNYACVNAIEVVPDTQP